MKIVELALEDFAWLQESDVGVNLELELELEHEALMQT